MVRDVVHHLCTSRLLLSYRHCCQLFGEADTWGGDSSRSGWCPEAGGPVDCRGQWNQKAVGQLPDTPLQKKKQSMDLILVLVLYRATYIPHRLFVNKSTFQTNRLSLITTRPLHQTRVGSCTLS